MTKRNRIDEAIIYYTGIGSNGETDFSESELRNIVGFYFPETKNMDLKRFVAYIGGISR